MAKIKLIATDIDGTLLNSKAALSKENEAYLSDLHQRGIQVVLVTSRTVSELPQNVIDKHLIRYVISANGAMIYDLQEEKVMKRQAVKNDIAARLYHDILTYRPVASLSVAGKSYTWQASLNNIEGLSEEEHDKYQTFFKTRKILTDQKMMLDLLENSDAIEKIHFNFWPLTKKEQALDYLAKGHYETILHITSSAPANIEITDIKASKLSGLKFLAEYLGVARNEVLTIGDGENDIAMFEISEYSIAMKNASDQVKQHACYVTDFNNDQNGWSLFIQKLLDE